MENDAKMRAKRAKARARCEEEQAMGQPVSDYCKNLRKKMDQVKAGDASDEKNARIKAKEKANAQKSKKEK